MISDERKQAQIYAVYDHNGMVLMSADGALAEDMSIEWEEVTGHMAPLLVLVQRHNGRRVKELMYGPGIVVEYYDL